MSAREQAAQLGVNGWVRNRLDGSVEITAEGTEDAISDFLAWCRQGPPHARVADVENKYAPATGEFASFRITY